MDDLADFVARPFFSGGIGSPSKVGNHSFIVDIVQSFVALESAAWVNLAQSIDNTVSKTQ